MTFSYVLNHSVHVLMYTYYFLALFGANMQTALKPVKRILTMVQISQFILMLSHCAFAIIYHCYIPNAILLLFCPNIALNLYLFSKFFRKSYLTKKNNHQQRVTAEHTE